MAGNKKKGGGEKDKAKAEKKKKQELKAQKKVSKKTKKSGGDDDEDDLDQILAELRLQDASRTSVSVEVCDAPSPRSNFSFSPLEGQNSHELLIFGGELFDGNSSTCYNDLYRFHLEKLEWKVITSPNTPDPRNAHQAVTVRDSVYVFGGEFSKGYQFHHYRDLWKLDLTKNSWTNIETKTGPSPRSGHRMILWKHFLVLFGGFYETSRGVKFYDDLYFFDLREEKRHLGVIGSKVDATPGPRSGFQMFVHNNTIFLYGGYSKVAISTNSQRGRNLDDMWALYLTPPPKTGMPPGCKWQRVSNKGSMPSRRSGATCCVHKNRMLLFGGVTDNETSNDIIGDFHNSLYSFDMDRLRWFTLGMKSGKSEKKAKEKKKSKRGDGSVSTTTTTYQKSLDEEEEEDDYDDDYGLDDNAFYVMIDGKITKVEYEESDEEDVEQVTDIQAGDVQLENISEEPIVSEIAIEEGAVEEEEAVEEEIFDYPSPRIGAGMVTMGNKLFVFGGTCEDGDKQITFDDLWCLDLNKMDGWTQIFSGTWKNVAWKGIDEEDDSEDDCIEGESEDGTTDDDDSEDSDDENTNINPKELAKKLQRLRDTLGLEDESKTPLPREVLRDFFRRTNDLWMREFLKDQVERLSGKEIRRGGFQLARARFDALWPTLQELDAIEEEQKLAEEMQEMRKEKMKDKLREKAKKRKAHLEKVNKSKSKGEESL